MCAIYVLFGLTFRLLSVNNNKILTADARIYTIQARALRRLVSNHAEHFGHYGAAHCMNVNNGRSGKRVSDEEETEN